MRKTHLSDSHQVVTMYKNNRLSRGNSASWSTVTTPNPLFLDTSAGGYFSYEMTRKQAPLVCSLGMLFPFVVIIQPMFMSLHNIPQSMRTTMHSNCKSARALRA